MTVRQADIDGTDIDEAAEEKAWAQVWIHKPHKKAGHTEGIAEIENQCSRKWGSQK